MRNLINFIIKHAYTLSFILVEIICFTLIFTNKGFHRASFTNSSNQITASIQKNWSSLTDFTKLKTVNDSLALENERLMNNLERYRSNNIPSIDRSGYVYISAKVVSATVNRAQNYITINKGKSNGIENEMGVIGANGIVGIVVSVSDKYATILPIINPESKTSVKLEKNNYFGSLSWRDKKINKAFLSEIPGYVNIAINDIVVTSGFGAIFPEGVPVGKISAFTKDPSTDFFQITVDLFTDFNSLSYVYVIKNINKKEQLQMTPEEDDKK